MFSFDFKIWHKICIYLPHIIYSITFSKDKLIYCAYHYQDVIYMFSIWFCSLTILINYFNTYLIFLDKYGILHLQINYFEDYINIKLYPKGPKHLKLTSILKMDDVFIILMLITFRILIFKPYLFLEMKY